jgi:hypothetical protein
VHAERAVVEHVGVDLGGACILVAEQLLDGSDVRAALEQVRGKTVTEGVASCSFAQTGDADGGGHRPLNHGLVRTWWRLRAPVEVSV